MKIRDLLMAVRDSITVRRVYSEPFEKDGVTIITGAVVSGGGGGGGGQQGQGQEGEGGGFGLKARPAGAFVIREGAVVWRPAIDVNRLVTVVGLVMAAGLLARARRRWLTRM